MPSSHALDVNVSLLVDEVLGGLNATLVSAGMPDAAKETLALNPLTPCTTISVETVQAARALAGKVVSEKSGGGGFGDTANVSGCIWECAKGLAVSTATTLNGNEPAAVTNQIRIALGIGVCTCLM